MTVKILLGAVALVLLAAPAHAGSFGPYKTAKQCIAEESQGLAGPEEARNICKPGVLQEPSKIGWHCASSGRGTRTYRAPGGFRSKRYVFCGEEG